MFLSLSFPDDLTRSKEAEEKKKVKYKKGKKRKNAEEPNRLTENDRKKNKREQMTKTRDEVRLSQVTEYLFRKCGQGYTSVSWFLEFLIFSCNFIGLWC